MLLEKAFPPDPPFLSLLWWERQFDSCSRRRARRGHCWIRRARARERKGQWSSSHHPRAPPPASSPQHRSLPSGSAGIWWWWLHSGSWRSCFPAGTADRRSAAGSHHPLGCKEPTSLNLNRFPGRDKRWNLSVWKKSQLWLHQGSSFYQILTIFFFFCTLIKILHKKGRRFLKTF